MKLEVLKFYRHARIEEQWVADSSAAAGPAVQVALTSPDGTPMVQQWLAADPLADEVSFGPVRLAFQRAAAASMLEDFLSPPSKDEGAKSDGILSMHYDGRMYRIPVRENVGKKVAVGTSGIRVEIAAYLPDARPDATAHFSTASREPNNPMLELKVYLPGKEQPLRQIAFAKAPLLSLDAIHGRNCPVKFWYHHPAVPPEAGIEFLQTPDGKLHYRVVADGKLLSHGEVKEGSQIPATGRLRLAVVKYLPHARQEITFLPVTAADDDTAAARIGGAGPSARSGRKPARCGCGGRIREYGYQQIATPEGPLAIGFGYETLPLGFSLKLVEFRHEMNPGMMGDASFASSVRVIDKARNVDLPAEIAMNQPLVYGGFTFYQSSYDRAAGGKQASILTVASDPGRLLKYLGCLMTCFGVFVVFYGGAVSPVRRGLPLPVGRTSQSVPEHGRIRKSVLPVLALALLTGGAASARAGERDDAAFDWRQWQSLPVQEGGRQKPLDTLARETFRTIGNPSGFSDPQTQRKLDPIALYLTLLFTWQGWDRPASPHGMPSAAGCPGQPATSKPDAWDREPLLLVDSAALRTALGLPANQNYISFLDLGRATIEIPKTGEKSLFLAWVQDLLRDRPRRPDELQRKGLELAERYWTYQDVRRGQELEVLPVPDSKTQQWVSVARLVQTNWDDKTDRHRRDPQGEGRTAKGPGGLSGKCRRGFQRGVGGLPCRPAQGRPAVGQLPLGRNHRPGSGLQPLRRRSASPGSAPCWRCSARCWVGRRAGGPSTGPPWPSMGPACWRCCSASASARSSPGGCRSPICMNRWCSSRLGTAVFGLVFRDGPPQVLRADGRRGRLHPGAAAGRHLPDDPRPQHPSADAGAAEQLLAGRPRDHHHAQLRRFCPGVVDGQYHARLPSAAFPGPGRRRRHEQAYLQALAGGRLAADPRHVPGRELGRLRLGAFLGLGFQGGLGADHAAGLPGPLARPPRSAGWAISACPPSRSSASRWS